MLFCTVCAASYELGTARCGKCGAALPIASPRAVDGSSPTGGDLRRGGAIVPRHTRIRRLAAGLIDVAICIGATVYIDRALVPRLLLKSRFRGLPLAFLLLAAPAAYAVLRDGLGGKSIGKLLTGLTVVNHGAMRRANVRDSFLRNVPFGFLVAPVFGWLVFLALSGVAAFQIALGKPRRVGDGMAGTTTVTDAEADECGV